MKFLNNVEISGSLTVGGTNIKTQLSTLQTSINTANTNIATANTNMNKIKTYVGSDGKLHFTNASGADTALNFSSDKVKIGSFTLGNSGTLTTITLGFKPKILVTYIHNSKYACHSLRMYIEEISTIYQITAGLNSNLDVDGYKIPPANSSHGFIYSINDDGFTFKGVDGTNYQQRTYIAIG